MMRSLCKQFILRVSVCPRLLGAGIKRLIPHSSGPALSSPGERRSECRSSMPARGLLMLCKSVGLTGMSAEHGGLLRRCFSGAGLGGGGGGGGGCVLSAVVGIQTMQAARPPATG